MDYCASAWYGPEKWGTISLLRHMERVQRIGARAVVLASKATALKAAQAEAGFEDTSTRLQRKVANHLVRSLTIPETNPLFDSLTRLYTQGKSYPSPLSITARKFGPTIGLTVDSLMGTVEPVLQERWNEGIQGCRARGLEGDEEEVIRQFRARMPRNDKHTLYTDAAFEKGRAGIAVVEGESGKIITQRTIPDWAAGDPTVAELIAIEAALAHRARKRPLPRTTIIATDSKRAIRHIVEGKSPNGQYIVRYIRNHIAALGKREERSVLVQWIPAHKGIKGNEKADRLAKETIEDGFIDEHTTNTPYLPDPLDPPTPSNPPNSPDLPSPSILSLTRSKIYQQRYARPTKKMALRVTRQTLQTRLNEVWERIRTQRPQNIHDIGAYTWQLDGALPGPHIAAVYNALSAAEASILVQCRTGHSRLRSNLYRKKTVDTAGCECGAARETITHVIYECPLLLEDRQIAIEAVGHRWRDLSYILRGWNPWEDPRTGQPVDGPREKWKADIPAVKAVLSFLCKTGGFAAQGRTDE